MLENLPPNLFAHIMKLWKDNDGNGNPNDILRNENAHRIAAHGLIEQQLEAKLITPEEAEKLRNEWDSRHGY
jgi:hypothetical protein